LRRVGAYGVVAGIGAYAESVQLQDLAGKILVEALAAIDAATESGPIDWASFK
jgi:hypothetical protein